MTLNFLHRVICPHTVSELLFNGASTAKGHSRMDVVEKSLSAGSLRSCPGPIEVSRLWWKYHYQTHEVLTIYHHRDESDGEGLRKLLYYLWEEIWKSSEQKTFTQSWAPLQRDLHNCSEIPFTEPPRSWFAVPVVRILCFYDVVRTNVFTALLAFHHFSSLQFIVAENVNMNKEYINNNR